MPEYIYVDENDHSQTMTHRMLYSTGVVCAFCGLEMWRKPQTFRVNWGGIKPSAGEHSPAVQELLDTADQRREAFEGEHEKHEQRTVAS